jgi:malate synthase
MAPPSALSAPPGIEVRGPADAAAGEVLTREALAFVAALHRRFEPERRRRLAEREAVQERFDRGWRPSFLTETRGIRAASWRVAPPPPDLTRRRVEITGPVERKMIINALNSGADVFMADFEDSNSPTWRNCLQGQVNLRDAVRRTISVETPGGKTYRLDTSTATLVVRPRGWHLEEAHLRVDGQPVSAALFDFGLYFFHNAAELLARGSGPYFYLPKLESHLEARLWDDVFLFAQSALGLPRGSVRATVLIETLPAAFEMDEILFELREHSSGLNCGRWDYIFSFVKKFRAHAECLLPDRWRVTMEAPFLRSYSWLAIQTCHRRGAHAIGGMAAFVPIKDDPERNAAALERVAADKRREAADGHDGTWVAHPGLIEVARRELEAVLQGRPHQIERLRDDVQVSAEDLLCVPRGPVTEKGLRDNLRIGLEYLAAWLAGSGCVALEGLMEDAATAEISRVQVWQWLRHRARLEDGRAVDRELVETLLADEWAGIRRRTPPAVLAAGHHESAKELIETLIHGARCADFLTLAAYRQLLLQGD